MESHPLKDIKGVGEKTAKLFAKLGIETAEALLRHYPRRYEFYKKPTAVSEAVVGEVTALTLLIVGQGSSARAGRRTITHFKAADPTGEVRLTFFNMPYLRSTLKAGSTHVFRGVFRRSKGGLAVLEHPQIFRPEAYALLEDTWEPRYPLTVGLKNKAVVKTMASAIEVCLPVEEYLDEAYREREGLWEENEALRGIHFPPTAEAAARARDRLVYDEFFAFLLTLQREKGRIKRLANPRPLLEVAETARLIERLPYALTKDQATAWDDIRCDLTGPYVMHRLLQGDVGSGKTILAFLALVLTACNGRQAALMVPTEVLAEQHMDAFLTLVKENDLPLRPILLTGSLSAAAKKTAHAAIEAGEADVIIGTHALIQEAVTYKDLGLVITDEQHRFGVRQRETLAGKGKAVPILVMSATPIPRTLAMILYGDLDISVLRSMPVGRLPIKNLALPQEERQKALRFLLQRLAEGRQAYIICPAIEEGETLEVENVEDYTEKLREALPASVRIASLTGRRKGAEKTELMRDFAAGDIDVLVATTVIEVGINVPNATVILIENAERFGLSQLHQLRGRVGRGSEQSYCIFLYASGMEEAPKRLQVLTASNDGFHIAEEDLKLRGPGELTGVRQSGELGFLLADIYSDASVLQKAAAHVEEVLKANPEYELPGAKSVDFRSL